MTARQVRSLDQRIADTKRELGELEAKKRVREDTTLKWLASVVRRLDKLPDTEHDDQPLSIASNQIETYLARAARKEDPALPFEEPGS